MTTTTEQDTDVCRCNHARSEHTEGRWCWHQFDRTFRTARNAPDRCDCPHFEFKKAASDAS